VIAESACRARRRARTDEVIALAFFGSARLALDLTSAQAVPCLDSPAARPAATIQPLDLGRNADRLRR
jgi:hypothetical protein